jgi:hypothetical protein
MMIAIMVLIVALSVALTAYAVSTYYATISRTITAKTGATGSLIASPSSGTISVVIGGSNYTLITLTNTGSVPLTISGISYTNYLGLSMSINDTGFVIQPNYSTICNLTISIGPNWNAGTGNFAITVTFSATG